MEAVALAQAPATTTGIPPKESNPSVFTSYVREAQVYDEAMVARWKVTMDGILLFAALFSAVVTAFIIESYKLLSPDPAALTLLILYQISQQLANGSQTVAFLPSPSQIPFSPPVLAILTNVFWFISLALSLTCALAATLIQQWASEYIHAIERRQAPEIRGRIRAFLFEGVESSKVSAVVEGTPALLHASLFSFLIGLVFFLHPINSAVTYLMSALLIACGTAYFCATIAPLISIASPIRTPLTTFIFQFSFIRNTLRAGVGTSWTVLVAAAQVLSNCSKLLVRTCIYLLHQLGIMVDLLTNLSRHVFDNRNLIDEQQSIFWMKVSSLTQRLFSFSKSSKHQLLSGGNLHELREKVALDKTRAGFEARETQALTWTLECLTTDVEFMQFIEGIPSYLNNQRNRWTEEYTPSRTMAALLQHDDYSFAHKQLSSLLEDLTERSISATLDLVSCLAGRRLFPYDLSFEERHSYWDVIPVTVLFYPNTLHQFPSLSSTINRTKFLVIIQCSEDISHLSQHPGLRPPEDYFHHIRDWVHRLCQIDVLIRQGKEFDEFKQCLDLLELSPSRWVQLSLDSPEVKSAMASLALKGLCNFVLEEIASLSFQTGSIIRDAIYRCVQFTSFLAEGSPQQQQAYAAAVWLITSILETQVASGDPSSDPQYFLTPILEPLVYIIDATALQTVSKSLASRVWWENSDISLSVTGYFGYSAILRDPAIASIYWVKGLYRITSYEFRIASHLQHCPSSLAGLPSILQNEVTSYLKWFGKTEAMAILQALAAALFRIAGTLDDAKAATEAMKHLERYIPIFDELYQNLDQTNKAQHLLDAKESLEKLKQTTKESGFVYQALVLRLDE
ncbi:hypothetical protein C8J56DRAFT_351154 [Mycena floridula]|nr:hypothetical protein C8J56DRAFT_351154 [Mycena floridula]